MRILRRALEITLAVCTTAAVAGAQKPVRLSGVVYDSLHHEPLSGASVTLSGTGRATVSDRHGRFQFDSVVPRRYTIVMMHDALDSLGLSGVGARVDVTDGRDTVWLAIPSLHTLWESACHSPMPADSGFVFGTVKTADQQGAAGATVRASWLDVGYDKDKGATSKQWHLEIKSDADGSYTLCGVPMSTGIRVDARTDSAASGYVDLLPGERIARRDLVMASLDSTAPKGNVGGVVSGDGGRLLSDARVQIEGIPETRTGVDGRFIIRNVPAGTRQVEVRAIGLNPVTVPVDVVANDLATVTIDLSKVTALDTVEVKASAVRATLWNDVLARKKTGLGYYKDSVEIARLPNVETVFRQMNGVLVDKRGNSPPVYWLPGETADKKCLANIFIDRQRTDQIELNGLYPDQIALVEVYPRMLTTPPEFVVRQTTASGNPTGANMDVCGTIIVWTKRVVP